MRGAASAWQGKPLLWLAPLPIRGLSPPALGYLGASSPTAVGSDALGAWVPGKPPMGFRPPPRARYSDACASPAWTGEPGQHPAAAAPPRCRAAGSERYGERLRAGKQPAFALPSRAAAQGAAPAAAGRGPGERGGAQRAAGPCGPRSCRYSTPAPQTLPLRRRSSAPEQVRVVARQLLVAARQLLHLHHFLQEAETLWKGDWSTLL